MQVTYLGPMGTTFSDLAWQQFAKLFLLPQLSDSNFIQSGGNDHTLGVVTKHGGYGVIPMETLFKGRISQSAESFIGQLSGDVATPPPIHVLAGIEMPISFCLMAKPGVTLEMIEKIHGHEEGIRVCRNHVDEIAEAEAVESNGAAAKMVAESGCTEHFAAIGPACAARRFGLDILIDEFEDAPARTTFLLVGPEKVSPRMGVNNRLIIVFRLSDTAGTLVAALYSFSSEGINMRQIHSMFVGDGLYDFFVEVDISQYQIGRLKHVKERLDYCTTKYLFFGPYEVVSV